MHAHNTKNMDVTVKDWVNSSGINMSMPSLIGKQILDKLSHMIKFICYILEDLSHLTWFLGNVMHLKHFLGEVTLRRNGH